MTPTPTEHRAKIAEARNVLGEVISRARYAGEPTVLINRGKEAAVIVSHPFYEQALRDRAVLELLRERAEEAAGSDHPDMRIHAGAVRDWLADAEASIES
ncbi:hypothetical protein SUDANB1_07120 [Streptomyces sp. enrichment culture]|uniref:type II toxin-antitoxin system prevent-host-death family antitoxin n=1 Tax=Streptomyces sp. enrichment culture TaxID=1795815 RepID=UPI003F568403